MTTFIVTKAAFLFDKADPASTNLGVAAVGTKFEGDLLPSGWIKAKSVGIKKSDGLAAISDGFLVRLGFADVVLTEPLPMAAEDAGVFVDLVTNAAREESTDRDYLLAVAYDLSNKLTSFGTSASPGIGPFQYTEKEWDDAIAPGGPAADRGLLPDDRLRWYQQPAAAAALTADATKKFKAAFNRPPKFVEMFFTRLFGDGALSILQGDRAGKCKDVIASAAAGSYAADLKASSLSVDDALAKLQDRLDTAYAAAAEVIKTRPDDIRLFRANEDDPPWMAVARDEMEAGVSEDKDERNTDQIKAYFTELGTHDDSGTTPWCAAFVGHCLKACGLPAIAATVNSPNAVGTTFWETWGVDAPNPPPVGTIVVLTPAGSPGHVGFLAEGSTATVTKLLGGNQGGGGTKPDFVGVVDFPVATNPIVARRGMAVAAPKLTADAHPGDELFVQKAPGVMQKLLAEFNQMKDFHAAAILGNAGQECGAFKQLRQLDSHGHELPENTGGYGWFQWDDRSVAFRKFAAAKGLDWKDDAANLGFLLFELYGTEQNAFNFLIATKNLTDAVVSFCEKYERAGTPVMTQRQRYATLALALFRSAP